MSLRLAPVLWFVLISILACGRQGDGSISHAASSAALRSTSTARGAGSLGAYQPTPDGAEVEVDVDPAQGSLQVDLALPSLPTRASFGPRIQLSWSGLAADAGQGFGVGFGLDVPSIQLTSDWGSPLPAMFANGDVTARLSLHGKRLVHVATEEALGRLRLEYRLEGSESDVRIFRWRDANLGPTTVPLTWPDRSERRVLPFGGAAETLTFQGFQVAYPDGQQEIYTEEPGMAEGQYVGTDYFPVRWPLRYAISAAGDVIAYEYEVANDARGYLKRVSFAGGRSEYRFDTVQREGGPTSYAHGFQQGAKHLYARMEARFDGARADEWCFVYRVIGASPPKLLSHPDCVDVATAEFGPDLRASAQELSRQDRLLGILRFGTSPAPFEQTTTREPTIRFRSTQWSRALLSSHPLVYDLVVPDVAGFGPSGGSELFDLNGDGLVDIARWRADTMAAEAHVNEGDLERKELLSRGPEVRITSIQDGTETARPLRFDSNDSADTALLAGDFDGDGNADVAAIRRIAGAADEVGLTVYRGPMDAMGRFRAVGSEARVPGRFRDFVAYRTRSADVNGDGKDDLLQAPYADGRSSWTVLVNVTVYGSSEPAFQSLGNLTFPFDGGPQWELNHPAYRLTDVNADGLVDLAVVRQDASATGLCVYENHGTVRAAPGIMAWLGDDLNVDGQSDELLFGEGGKSRGICGRGYYLPIEGIEASQNLHAFWMVDADGDGCVDLATVDAKTGRELLVWLGHGRDGFESPFRMSVGDGSSLSVDPNNPWNTRVADIDGDGWEEIAVFNPAADSRRMRVVDFNRNGTSNWIGPDVLVGVDEGAGIRHGFEYSSVGDETLRDRRRAGKGALETTGLPHPQMVVKRHVREVTWLPAAVREYQYHGPTFDGLYREFLGFERAEVFAHGDSTQPSVGTFYRFGDDASEGACSWGREVCARFLADKPRLQEDATLVLSADQSERIRRAWNAQVDTPSAASAGAAVWSESPLTILSVLSSESEDWRLVPAVTAGTVPVFIRREQAESLRCGPESCEAPARTTSEFAYDGSTNRLDEELVTRPEVVFADPGDRTVIPPRVLRRTVAYDPVWTARGVSGAVAGETVRSERSGATLSSSSVAYADDAPLPTASGITVLTDRSGLPSEVAQLLPGEQVRTRTFEYDDFGNVVLERDERSAIVRRVFDSTGVRILETANALGHAVRTCYGSAGCPLSTPAGVNVAAHSIDPTHVESPQGETIVSEYDERHRVTRMVSSAGGEARVAYDDGGERSAQRVLVKERSGLEASEDVWLQRLFAFSPDGMVLGVAVAESPSSSRVLRRDVHNRFGQIAYSAEPYVAAGALEFLWSAPADMVDPVCGQGTWTCSSYDALGRTAQTLASSGAERASVQYFGWGQRLETEFSEDHSGNQAWVKRVKQRVAADDEVYAVVDERGIAWRFDYDERGALTQVQPPGRPGRAVRRNSAGELVYADIASGMRRAWKRDERGRVEESRTWNWGLDQSESLVHGYDDLDRIVGTVASTSRREGAEHRTAFAYDRSEAAPTDRTFIGRLVDSTAKDESSGAEISESFAYDARGRVLQQTLACAAAGVRRSYVEEFGYTLDGAVSRYRDAFDNRFDYAHNSWGAPASVTWTSPRTETKPLLSDARYHSRGPVASFRQALGAGALMRELAYEPATGRLSGQAACVGQTSCVDATAPVQRRVYVRRADGLSLFEGNASAPPDRAYTYSDRGELVGATWEGKSWGYEYGEAGEARRFDEGTPRSFSTAASSGILPLPEGYEADGFGRVTSTPTIGSIEYDARSRPREVSLRDGRRIEYAYSHSGRRVAKVVSGAAAEAAPSLVVYPNPSARDDGVQQQSLVRFGEHAIGLIVDGERMLGLLDDARGVSEGLLTEEGSLAAAWSVSPYGTVHFSGEPAQLGLRSAELLDRFTGQVRDEDSGAVLMGAREYFPELGSFSVPDPYFLESPEQCAGSLLECDLYAYVGHDPVNELDETGLAKARADKSGALLRKLKSVAKHVRKQIGRPTRHLAGMRGRALDRAFGAAKPPGGMGVKAFERAADGAVLRNPELQVLTSGTKAQLEPGREYLWVVDEGGTMLIGEEVPTGVVESNGYVQKLGHPTLTQGGLGRIAGELRFENGGWVMNNDSGRYSGHADRTERQLDNARKLLQKRGVRNVTTSFNARRLPSP